MMVFIFSSSALLSWRNDDNSHVTAENRFCYKSTKVIVSLFILHYAGLKCISYFKHRFITAKYL